VAATASILSPYEVVSDAGLTLGKTFYSKGARLGLTPDQAYYLQLSGSVRALADLVVEPPPVYVPPVVGPITPTESNTLVELVVSGLSTFVTIENLVNLFPKLRPQRGEKGDRGAVGEKGDRGEAGERGPSVVVNGHQGDSVTVTAADVGLGNVANLAPSDLPVSIRQAQAIRDAVAQLLDDLSQSGSVDLQTLSGIVATKASRAELTTALGQLVDGASGSANTLGKLESLVVAAQQLAASADGRVSAILAGSNVAVDTFLEAYNKFVADESAAAALTAVVATKASQADLTALQGVVGTKASQADLVGLAVDTLDAVNGKLDSTPSALVGLLTTALDGLPSLPTDPSSYPAQGGLFRDGDANGYRLVRIFPAS